MKLNFNNNQVKSLVAIQSGKEIYTSSRWRDAKKHKFLYELKKLGYYKQIGRFRFITGLFHCCKTMDMEGCI